MRRKIVVLQAIALGLLSQGFSQYQENLPQAKPIPPNAAALFKTLERPVGTYTGTIPINFPLCGVSSGPLSINLSLDYNSTGGIKVEELGGPVGLGFNLNDGGGRITQIVRGKRPDDWGGILNGASSIRPSNWACDMDDVEEVDMMEVDLEYDIFMYSFNGRSGKFYIKENGQIIMTRNDGIKIDYGSTPNANYGFQDGWVITDEKGFKYHFLSRIMNESSYSSNGGSGSTSVSSISYYLDYIEDMSGQNTIWFTYTGTGNTFSTYSGGFLSVGSLGCCCSQFHTSYDQGSVTTDGSEYLVSRIDAESGYVLVNSTAAYPYGPKRVTSVQLYDPSNNLKKQYKFNYGSPFESYRQKLINFSEFGASGTDSLTTKFEYIETENLPSVFSPSVDIWGFYNGAGNYNTGLIPNIIYPVPGVNVTLDWTYWANRNANWYAGRANILKKITYSTGGYRELEYEGNEAFADGDFFMYHPNPSFLAPYMIDRDFNETSFNNYGTYWPCLQHLFTVNSTTGNAKFYYTLSNPDWTCGAYTVKIMRLLDSTDLDGGVEVESFIEETEGNKLLVNGYYRIDVMIGDNPYDWNCTMDGIAGEWQECTLVDTSVSTPYGNFYSKTARPVGGVRVKEVKDYDPITNKISKREYKYKIYSTDSTLNSGVLVSPVNILQTQNISTTNCEYLTLCPGSSYPLASEGGSFVVYPEVRTIDSANGWTDHIYSFAPDYPGTSFPYVPTEDMSFRRGHLVSEKIYDKNATLLNKKEFGYTERYGSISQIGYKYKPYWYVGAYDATYTEYKPTSPYHSVGIMACNQYGSMGIFWTPRNKVETTYTPSGAVKDSIAYTYSNYNDYYYLKNESAIGSNGTTKTRTYRYAFNNNSDFKFGMSSGEQTVKADLLDKNFFQPLEVVDSIKPSGGSYSFLQGSKYVFGYFNGSEIYLGRYRSFSTTTDSTDIIFSNYDYGGELRESYKNNDAKEVTLWGYRNNYPVVKVTGSTYSTVAAFVDTSILNNPSSDAALRTELNKIRTGLAGSVAQVTTYTYSPLFGMTSMTDPEGRTIYYEYDVFGRLKLVRDQDNRILKKNEYKLNNPL